MDRGTANVPHLLALYLFRHAEGRKSMARLSGGHFVGRLAAHFGLVNDEGLRGLSVVIHELPLIDLHDLGRLNILDEGAQDVPAPVQAPQPSPPAPQPQTTSQRIERIKEEMHDYMTRLMDASGLTYQAFNITLVGSSRMPYQRCVRPRTGNANTSAAPHTDDQPDP
ncbi:hypothetical protein Tco_1136878 [Tanacetum coccineum]